MSSAANLYKSVIDDVVNSVRDCFLDESVDENVLQELKQIWMAKLDASKTIDPPPKPQDQILDAKMASSKASGAARNVRACLLYTSPSPRDRQKSRMPSSA